MSETFKVRLPVFVFVGEVEGEGKTLQDAESKALEEQRIQQALITLEMALREYHKKKKRVGI